MRLFYFAALTDSGCLLGCDHQHETVLSAAACISNAGGYVIAVEKGELRALSDEEEAKFQEAIYGAKVQQSQRSTPCFAAIIRITLNPRESC